MAGKCLVCGAQIKTQSMHMGIEACRACAVFYRRAARAQGDFHCKFSSDRCVKEGRVLECRRCRFELMRGIFERANLEILPELLEVSRPKSSSAPSEVLEESNVADPSPTSSSPPQDAAPRRLSYNSPSTSIAPTTSRIERIRAAYETRSRTRKVAELCLRTGDQFVQPMSIYDDSFKILPAAHEHTAAMRHIELTTLLDFAEDAFPEFRTLTANEKWHLAFGCCMRMGIMESTYRSAKMFPEDERVFVSYTTTLCTESMDTFFNNSSLAVKSESAATALRKNLGANAGRCKQAMRRISPTEEEFLVLLALSFWNTEISSGDERLSKMAAANRTAIMQELHDYYATKGLIEYAARIGELFCLLVDNERVASLITEDMELLRLMDTDQLAGIL